MSITQTANVHLSTTRFPKWVTKKRKNLIEWSLSLDINLNDMTPRNGPTPIHPALLENIFVFTWSFVPIIIQYIWYMKTNIHWNPFIAFIVYLSSLSLFGMHTILRIRKFGHIYGYLDSKNHSRDRVMDGRKNRLFSAIISTVSVRTMIATMFAYNPHEIPNITWKLLFDIILYMIILDYLYYTFHRSLHQFPILWKIHRIHHISKHPTALMAPYASEIQEVFDIFIIPLGVYIIRPISFHHLYIAILYVIYIELLGHSGLRAYWPHPLLGYLLRPFDMDLVIEDHDLHHRYGRSSGNFGKQTRIFDKLFHTITKRKETGPLEYVTEK